MTHMPMYGKKTRLFSFPCPQVAVNGLTPALRFIITRVEIMYLKKFVVRSEKIYFKIMLSLRNLLQLNRVNHTHTARVK